MAENDQKLRLTYRNGSGHKVVYLERCKIVAGGDLRAQEVDGTTHFLSAGADWHVEEIDELPRGIQE